MFPLNTLVPTENHFMVVPCEVAVKSVIPAIRAYVARELTQTHKMKQNDAANILGITQTAISKYIRHVRGQVIKIDQTKEIQKTLKEIALKAAHEKISGQQLTLRLCEVCQTVRQNRLMCELCKRSDPKLDIALCNVCKNGKLCTSHS